MKRFQSELTVIIIGALITPGLIIVFWHFQLISYVLLAKYSLILFPLITLGVFFFNKNFPIYIQEIIQQKFIFNFILSFCISLILTQYRPNIFRYLISLFILTILFIIIFSVFMKNIKPLFNTLFLIVGFAGIPIFIYMAYFVRMYGDDFCFAIRISNNGFLKTIINFYQTWSGRLFTDLFMIGFSTTNKIMLIEISLFILVTFFALYLIRANTQRKKISLWIISNTVFLPFLVFSALPDPYKSLYWIANAQFLFPTSILIIFLIAFMAKGILKGFQNEKLSMATIFLLCLGISNGHEILSPAMMFTTFSLLLYSIIFRKKHKPIILHVSIAALIGTVAGILILVIAPGNYARMAAQNYPPIPDLFSAITLSFGFYIDFLLKLTDAWKWVLFPAALFAGIMSDTLLPKGWRYSVVLVVVMVVSSWGTFLMSAFAMSATLPMRTQFMPILFLIIGFFTLGATIPRIKPTFVIKLVAIGILFFFAFVFKEVIKINYKLVDPMVQFSIDWDKRDYDVRINKFDVYEITIPWDYREQQIHCIEAYYLLPEN